MNAFEIPGQRFSLVAGAAVERYRFVTVNSANAGITAVAASNVIGVSMNEAASGEVLDVADGLVIVMASGAVASGAAVYSDADGKATTTSTSAVLVGTAITTGAAGTLMTVKI